MADQAPLAAGFGGAGLSHTTATLTQNGPTETALAAWTAVLDMLEMAVGAAERTLKDPLGPLSSAPQDGVVLSPQERWSPPTLPGPLPPEARRRAVALSAAQERVARRLEEARLDVARQLQAVTSVPGVGESSSAVYLDVNG
ncbi:hypothetical protein [Pseudarthrobacter sp. MM222]|uniref:hypothetical protein n=1 Tax=Pseudarthrobacter sp. MM222 TaxID=3018929 RepID=UPI00221F40F1|nr:hypothetical protein [Pseudarthrobacter sp. MM222]CAI3792909.1 hypothetical protein NKCBBBOE_00673 [Pseudarthrobacter sp. MM222]